MGLKQTLGRAAATNVPTVAPKLTSGFVRKALHHAIHGAGPLKPAGEAAAAYLADHDGDVDAAIKAAQLRHAQYAGAQGLLTNIGGIVTVAVTIPANISGLTMIQARLIAITAHLRGYDLDDPRVQNAVLACMMGPGEVKRMLKKKTIPAPPMAIATAPQHDPELDVRLSNEVAVDLITRVMGKRFAVTVSRRVPVLGGVVGMSADGWATWQLGRYAASELLPRPKKTAS